MFFECEFLFHLGIHEFCKSSLNATCCREAVLVYRFCRHFLSAAASVLFRVAADGQSQLDSTMDSKSAGDSSPTTVVTYIILAFNFLFNKLSFFILLTTPAAQVRQDHYSLALSGSETFCPGTTSPTLDSTPCGCWPKGGRPRWWAPRRGTSRWRW